MSQSGFDCKWYFRPTFIGLMIGTFGPKSKNVAECSFLLLAQTINIKVKLRHELIGIYCNATRLNATDTRKQE